MKKASITETKNNLSALIEGLRGGSPVLIVDRGRPVARLEPVAGREEGGQNGRLSRLIRDGVLRPRRTDPPRRGFQRFSAARECVWCRIADQRAAGRTVKF